METSSDSESIGSSISRMYTNLDVPARRKYREGLFSDKMSRKISLEEQEDSPSRKISQEEMDESLMTTSRKVSREELDTDTPLRKTSREELETTMDLPKELTGNEGTVTSRKLPRDLSVDSTKRFYSTEKLYSPTSSINIDQRQRSFRERKDQMGDSICRAIPKSDIDTDITSVNRYSDALMSASMKQRDNLEFSSIQRGRMFRENSFDATFESSIESSKKLKTFAGKTDSAKDIPPRMMAQDDFNVSPEIVKKDISMHTAFRKMTGDEFDTSIENQRGRSFKESRDVHMETQRVQRSIKIDNPVDSLLVKMQREVLGVSPEAITNPGPPGPPDLTVSSLMVLKPPPETLSTMVYDGILEKSYENPVTPAAGDLGYGAGVSGSSQSLLVYEGSLASLSSSESSSKDKGKKSSMLKNLFKKKKEKDKD